MKSTSCLVIIALIICGAAAQKGAPSPPIVEIPSKQQPTTPPKPIDESEHKKECPAGFKFVGKQCAKTLTAQPSVVCPAGTIKVDGKCAKYVGKDNECPTGYQWENGQCARTSTALPELVCPAGFTLTKDEKCVKKVPLPELKECPAGTVPKGDQCVKTQVEPPEYVCPASYTLIGKKCQREATFDCTPPRKPQPPPPADEKRVEIQPVLRHPDKESMYRPQPVVPVIEEYVIQETCKRIITEDARPICPKGSNWNGKMCEKDVIVPEITKPGGFTDKVVPAVSVCPEGFLEVGAKGECSATEYVLPDQFCPAGTIDIGDKCATYTQPKVVCPDGFYLDGKICTKTIFAAPLVEFTVTYACTGKDCARH